jgi:type VI protein secretion system component VasF
MLFFQALEELLDGLLPAFSTAGGTGNPDDTQEGDALPARLEAAARIDRAENFARRELDVFALCLLLGFCGRYFEMPQLREKLRVAARKVLQGSEGEKAPPFARESWRGQEIPRALEWLFYALLPLVGAFLFGLYCANLLIDLPKPGF